MQRLRWSIPQSRKSQNARLLEGIILNSLSPSVLGSRSYSITIIAIRDMPILICSLVVWALASNGCNAINGTRSAAFTIFSSSINCKFSRDYYPWLPIVEFYHKGTPGPPLEFVPLARKFKKTSSGACRKLSKYWVRST